MDPKDVAAKIDEWLNELRTTSEPGNYTEELPEVVDTDYLEEVDRDTYHEAMEMVFDQYDVPEEMREQVYQQLDAEGEYTPAGYIKNLTVIVEDEDIYNDIDNSLTVEHGAEVHGDITQQNTTNVANATGEDSIAGRDQEGQFQTGDGVQVGDYNDGVVNQGDNSGQQAGDYATADDITTGDGNFNNEGTIEDSAIAFGGGAANNTANDVYDASTNDSFNEDNVGNVNDSFNEDNVGNTTVETTHTVDENIHEDIDVTGSYNEDNDGHDIDDSYNEGVELHD
jgi:hypothetical protein